VCNVAGELYMSKMSGDCDFNVSDFERISQTDIDACQKEFKTGGAEGCRRLLEIKQEEWKNIPLNVAVIGNSGVGKSSFINAIRCAHNFSQTFEQIS